MDEYIKREQAERAVKETLERPGIPEGLFLAGVLRILSIPAADVEPVRRGRWELLRPGEWTATFRCSECGRHITVDPKKGDPSGEYPYCHCGAKMEGADEDHG